MIENIKRFVNEHKTLMVVVFVVLVISFIYWWFCCRGRTGGVKVKGGKAGHVVVQELDGVNNYEVIGVHLDIPIIVLSKGGERLLPKVDGVINYFYIYFNEYILPKGGGHRS